MSETLNVHRKTLVRAYEELDAQGWIEMRPSQGTFTSKELPEIAPGKFSAREEQHYFFPATTGYTVKVNEGIRTPVPPLRHITGFHDGPDVRLMPVEELGRAYRSVMSRKVNLKYLSYVGSAGIPRFRKTLSDYLNASRGLQTGGHIMMTRGSQQGIFMLSHLLKKGDAIIVGIPVTITPIMCSSMQA